MAKKHPYKTRIFSRRMRGSFTPSQHLEKYRSVLRSYTISQIHSGCDPQGKANGCNRRHDRRKARAINGSPNKPIGTACTP